MKRYDSYKDSGVKWIGEIPSHWKVKTLRNFLRIISDKGHPKEQLLSVVREQGVIIRNTVSKDENHNFIPDDLRGYKLVREGQFVINKMKSWQGSYAVSNYQGIVSPAYYTCDLRFDNKEFFNIAIRSKAYVPFFSQYSKGIRVGQWDLDPINLKRIPFFLPPLSEQHAIVSFLDTELEKIDTYMDKEQQLIERLKELKQSLIARAVTHGINPNVKMKPSGINWIGEIPEHWKVKTLRSFLRIISDKGHPKEQLLSVVREQGVIIRNTVSKDENHNFIPDDLRGYKLVREGQFVINKMKSWQGSYAVSNYQGIVSPAYYTCDLRFDNKEFFNIAIRSKAYVPFFSQYSKGIRVGQWDLDPINLKKIPFFLPPLAEQRAIVDYLQDMTSKIDKLITEKTREMEYMKELRQRIISDAVTGKIDVRS